jgi:hypothetical protein
MHETLTDVVSDRVVARICTVLIVATDLFAVAVALDSVVVEQHTHLCVIDADCLCSDTLAEVDVCVRAWSLLLLL